MVARGLNHATPALSLSDGSLESIFCGDLLGPRAELQVFGYEETRRAFCVERLRALSFWRLGLSLLVTVCTARRCCDQQRHHFVSISLDGLKTLSPILPSYLQVNTMLTLSHALPIFEAHPLQTLFDSNQPSGQRSQL